MLRYCAPLMRTGVFVVQGVRVGGGGASFICGIAGVCPGSSDASNPGVHMVFCDPRGTAQGLSLPEHLDASRKYPLYDAFCTVYTPRLNNTPVDSTTAWQTFDDTDPPPLPHPSPALTPSLPPPSCLPLSPSPSLHLPLRPLTTGTTLVFPGDVPRSTTINNHNTDDLVYVRIIPAAHLLSPVCLVVRNTQPRWRGVI